MSDFVLGPRLKSISLNTDECVIWPGAMREGYGVKKMGNTTVNAHRYVYETSTKKKIPKGWHIDHTCRNRRCINPKHLEPVSPSENKTRAWAFKGGNYKSKYYKGEPVEKALTEEQKKKAKIAGGTAAGVGGALYGRQVVRGARAVRAERTFTPEQAKKYGEAADKFVAEGRSQKKKFAFKYYDKERRNFVKENPDSKKLRPTVRRWEDHYREVQAIRDAKPMEGTLKNKLLHPVKTRRSADQKIMTRMVENGTKSGKVYRTMTLNDKPKGRFAMRPMSSWTPHKKMAENFASDQRRYQRTGTGFFANQPKDLKRRAKPVIFEAEGVQSANLSPLSRFGNVDERVSNVKNVNVGNKSAPLVRDYPKITSEEKNKTK